MEVGTGTTQVTERVLSCLDLERAVELVQEVCRIPSVLGAEGPLAELSRVGDERAAEFEAVELQPVLPRSPQRDRGSAFGRREVASCSPVTWTPSPSPTAGTCREPFSGDLIDGSVYGHGIMDMKAALVCQIVAIEAVRASGLPISGTLAMAAVADHMGDQLGSIAYFDEHPADLCVLRGAHRQRGVSGASGPLLLRRHDRGRSAHTCPQVRWRSTRTSWPLKPCWRSTHRAYEPELEPWVVDLFGSETYVVPGRIYGGLPPGGPSMIPGSNA